MTDDNQNETGADSSARDILSGCYDPKDASPALVERFRIAQQHVDTWTWQHVLGSTPASSEREVNSGCDSPAPNSFHGSRS